MWYFRLEHKHSRLLQVLKEQQDHSLPLPQWTLTFKPKLNHLDSSPCLKRTKPNIFAVIYIFLKKKQGFWCCCFNLNLFIFKKEHPKLILLRNRINNVFSVLDTWTLLDSILFHMFNQTEICSLKHSETDTG